MPCCPLALQCCLPAPMAHLPCTPLRLQPKIQAGILLNHLIYLHTAALEALLQKHMHDNSGACKYLRTIYSADYSFIAVVIMQHSQAEVLPLK